MKKVKSAFWLLLAGFLLILFFSNLDYFLKPQAIDMNLIFKKYTVSALPNAVISLLFFGGGLLIAFLSNLPERYRLQKTIRDLKSTIASQSTRVENYDAGTKTIIENSTTTNS